VSRARAHEGPDGFAVVDKPAGWTSHDVVAKARGLLGTRKVGHSGTLDPDVTGVLLLGVGRGTRLLRYMTALGKRYEGTFVLGVETTTLDASGEVVATHDQSAVTLADVQRVAAERFTGLIMQIPPMVSAVKVGGRRLHELAREGIEVEREPRPVTIYELTISDGPDDTFGIQVHCSSGTYVRSLVADIGTALGGGAHLATLRRTAVGAFGIDEAVPLESLSPDAVLPLPEVARTMAHLTVDDERGVLVRHGRRMERGELGVDDASAGPWAVLDEAGSLLAVYEDHGAGTVKPAVVLVPA
jgi:tRNA pseudouridine55 synthase